MVGGNLGKLPVEELLLIRLPHFSLKKSGQAGGLELVSETPTR